MSRGQIVILLGLSLLVCCTFAALVALVAFPTDVTTGSPAGLQAQAIVGEGDGPGPEEGAGPATVEVAFSAEATATPSATPSPLPTSTTEPTATSTLVVITTPTATKTPRPTRTPTSLPTATSVPSGGGGGGGGGGSGTGRTPTPAVSPSPTHDPRFPLRVMEGPVGYTTENHLFVVYMSITDANRQLLPGYRVIGDHVPSGFHWESIESCRDFCVASGPSGFEEDGLLVRKGNVKFEAPAYVDGTWTLRVVDSSGATVSDRLVFNIKDTDDDRQWFYMWLSR